MNLKDKLSVSVVDKPESSRRLLQTVEDPIIEIESADLDGSKPEFLIQVRTYGELALDRTLNIQLINSYIGQDGILHRTLIPKPVPQLEIQNPYYYNYHSTDHMPSGRVEDLKKYYLNVTFTSVYGASAVGMAASGATVGFCPNWGSPFLKLIQLIEIYGKFLFMPIVFKDWLLDGLWTFDNLSEFIELKEDSILKSGQHKDGYNGKISIYHVENLILRSIPTICLQIVMVFIFNLLLLISKRLLKIKLVKPSNFLEHFEWFVVEAHFIDLIFAGGVSILKYSEVQISGTFMNTKLTLDTLFSLGCVSWIIYKQFSLTYKAWFTPKKLKLMEADILIQGIDESSFISSKYVRIVTQAFKIKIMVVLLAIISL